MLADVILKVAAEIEAEKPEARYFPRPSIAGPDRCLRQMVFWARSEKRKPLPGRAVLVFDDSSWHEYLTADWIQKTGFVLHSQQMGVTLRGALDWNTDRTYTCQMCGEQVTARDLHGHIDGVITDPLGTDWLWEHKAVNHYAFERYMRAELPTDYIVQTAIYLRGIREYQPALRKCLLLVKNKNQSAYLEIQMEYDHEADSMLIDRIVTSQGDTIMVRQTMARVVGAQIERFRLVEQHRTAGTLPDRQYRRDEWQCQYCPYFETCYAGYVDEITAMQSQPLPDDLAAVARRQRALDDRINAMTAEREEVNESLRRLLRERKIRGGTAEGISVSWVVSDTRDYVQVRHAKAKPLSKRSKGGSNESKDD